MQFSSLYTTTTTMAQPWKVPNFLCRNKREKQKRVKKGGAQLALCVMNVSPIYPIFLKAADAFNFHGTQYFIALENVAQVDKMQNIIYASSVDIFISYIITYTFHKEIFQNHQSSILAVFISCSRHQTLHQERCKLTMVQDTKKLQYCFY